MTKESIESALREVNEALRYINQVTKMPYSSFIKDFYCSPLAAEIFRAAYNEQTTLRAKQVLHD